MAKEKKKKKKEKEAVEDEELQEGKKGKKGKKKLLLIPVILILVAAIGAAAVLFILPRFGINLLGGTEPGPGEEKPPKNLETFVAGEVIQNEDGEDVQDSTISLDTILEDGEGTLIAVRTTEESVGDDSAVIPAQNTYIYDVAAPAEVVNRYLDAVLGGDEKFVLVDETYLPLEERPELEDALGVLTLARASVQDGHLFQMVIGWSEASSLTIRTSAPEGAIQKPKTDGSPAPVIETVPVTQQLERLKGMTPAELGLAGDSMDEYDIYPVEGFVKVDDLDCRRFNVYQGKGSGSSYYTELVGIVMLSSDQKHIFYMDPISNAVTEMR